jgi:hypothetical protein
MSAWVKPNSIKTAFLLIILVVVCAGSLAFHFLAEGFELGINQTYFDLSGPLEHSHSLHEHSEDHFTGTHLPTSVLLYSFNSRLIHQSIHSTSISISPLLPPPNF